MKLVLCYLLLVLVLVGFAAPINVAQAEDISYPPLKSKYVIVSDSVFAPFEFQNEDGKYVGIDVDLMNAVASRSGFEIDMKFVGFDAAVQSTISGEADGAIAGMTITDARKVAVDFSDPYYDTGSVIGVKQGNNKKIYSYDDLRGKTVGVKIGTTSEKWLVDNQTKYGYLISRFDTGDQIYSGVTVGTLDALMDDKPILEYAIVKGQKLETVGDPIPTGQFGFAVAKGKNPELIRAFNEQLGLMKESGEYQRIIDKYSPSNQSAARTQDESTILGLLIANRKVLFSGFIWTVSLALLSFAIALLVSLILGVASYNRVTLAHSLRRKVAQRIVSIYVNLVRGIPLLVLVFFIYYGIPQLTGITLSTFFAACLALVLNASAYLTEIVRSGINSVPHGQREAATTVGLSYRSSLQHIILPQALRTMMPSFINQFIISLKDTTIVSVIGVVELLQTGRIIVSRNLQSFSVYLIIGVIYLVLISVLTYIAKRAEKSLK